MLFNFFGTKKKDVSVCNVQKEDSSIANYLKSTYIEKGYDVIPYIPSDMVAKDLNKNSKFLNILLPHKSYMTYINKEKLITGHIIMLWWLKETKRTQVPSYFIYDYGINFDEELLFLRNLGYIDVNNELTNKGEVALKENFGCIRNHKARKVYKGDSIEYFYTDAEAVAEIVKFKTNGDYLEDQRLGSGFEKINDYDNAILAYKSAIKNAKKVNGQVPPNPYNRLAVIYRKLNDKQREIAIIKEGIKATDYPQAKTGHKKLVDRLSKLKEK